MVEDPQSWFGRAWAWLVDKDNRAVLSWLGAGLSVAAGGFWKVWQGRKRDAPDKSGAVVEECVAPPVAAATEAPRLVAKPRIKAPSLRITTLTAVDCGAIQDAFRRFGCDWPEPTIEWPPVSDELVQVLGEAKAALNGEARKLVGAQWFGKGAERALPRIKQGRLETPAAIPPMIGRLKAMDTECRVEAVRVFLLLSNFAIHQDAAYHAQWQGVRELGLENPAPWASWSSQTGPRRELFGVVNAGIALILGEQAGNLVNARLVRLGPDDMGLPFVELDVALPKKVRRDASWSNLGKMDFCRWIVPQVERAAGTLSRGLPTAYTADCAFSKFWEPEPG